MSKENSNFSKPVPPRMKEAEYLQKLSSKNPIAQIKLFVYNYKQSRSTPATTPQKVNRFKTRSLIFGGVVLGWALFTRDRVKRLKNDDDATFLADQEIRRVSQKGP